MAHQSRRVELLQKLISLPAAQLDQVIYIVNPPRENMPRPENAAQTRVTALLEWVESPIGCGLDTLEEALNQVTKHPPPSPSKPQPNLKRRSFLKYLIPAGIGVLGVSIFGVLFKENESPPVPSPPNSTPTPTNSPSPSPSPTDSPLPLDPELFTSDQVDTNRLEQLLAAQQWSQADRETVDLLKQFLNPAQDVQIEQTTLNLPCEILAAIDSRWVHYSQGQYGFSVQAQIFKEICAGEAIKGNTSDALTCFEQQVGWLVNGRLLSPQQMDFDLSVARRGQLPFEAIRIFNDELLERTASCSVEFQTFG